MSSSLTILVTAVGSGVAQSIVKALRLANLREDRGYRLIGTDARPLCAGLYRGVDKGVLLPTCSANDYVERMIAVCNDEKVDVLIPGCDPEVSELSKSRNAIESNTNTRVIVSSAETVEIGFDKWKTYEFLRDNSLPYPKTARPSTANELAAEVGFPLIAKPGKGSGSVGLMRIGTIDELNRIVPGLDSDYVIQECLRPADSEYTTGVIFDTDGTIMDSITMWRRIKKGASYFARVDEESGVGDRIESVAKHLTARGPINLQSVLTGRGPVVFEINPRFSGTTAARAVAGLNEPDVCVRNIVYGKRVSRVQKRSLTMMRYLTEVYVPSVAIADTERDGWTSVQAEVHDYF